MRNIIFFVALLLAVLVAGQQNQVLAKSDQSVFDQVMNSGVLRCGYYVFPPATYRDPNTKELSGFSIDLMNEIGKRSGLKIEWSEETNFSNWIPSLQAGRFDVACTPNWPDIPQLRAVAFSTSMFYAGLSPMVRADDSRFSGKDLKVFNDEAVTFATPDGDAIGGIVAAKFPKAKIKYLSADGDISSFAMDVITKKSDAFISDRNGLYEFNKNNPIKLKLFAPDQPLKLQAFSLAVEAHQVEMKNFLDNAIAELQHDGTMDRLLRKWESEPGKTYLRVSSPAQLPSN